MQRRSSSVRKGSPSPVCHEHPRVTEATSFTNGCARGYHVFPVNPNADTVEGDPAYLDLKSIPGGVAAVVIGTRPETADETMRECAELGVKYVWMHRSFSAGSVSDTATKYGRSHGISVIDGGCPLMFEPTSDGVHKVMRFIFTMTGKVPRRCEAPTLPASA